MIPERKVAHVYAFWNGMTLVFDQHGEHMPEFDGWTEDVIPKLRETGFTGAIEPMKWLAHGNA